ncbi:hypothetical protein UFOVP1204_48 [uncultured Caudovirales phage]|uniref:Uncharacterized protein n=1 Tax=uncultured Caudovirales phage TaxID=2100421 RepID=A0A6J5REV6_9CAUD|nr:hypothetical protein UFOVP473_53 [uncultured Caudovirales phage]CAB4176774.1 hypothetical protein UFOVP983_53 [uncultured Caudovirales phage]CAB4190154.1 hypothetical protein UFOVP1204_48 [uncultured Caudovirales phage]
MAEHSPTPWQSVADRGGRTIGDANGIFVAAALEATDTALIVRAVNAYVAITSSPGPGFQSYEDLVAENERLRAALKPFTTFNPDPERSDENLCRPRAYTAGQYRRARAALNPQEETP